MEEKPVGKSIKKVIFRFVLNLVLVIFWIPIALTFHFQDPFVQTQTARLITNVLSRQIGNKVMIKRLKLDVNSGVSLFGVKLADHHDSTMIAVNELHARPVFREFGLLTMKFVNIEIDSAVFRYGRYKDDQDFNLSIFLQKLSGDKDPDEETSGSPFKISSRHLTLKRSIFHLFDDNKEYDNQGGMDYADMMYYDINLEARNFKMINDSLNIVIDSLKTIEKSGLRINKLTTHFSIANSGLVAKGLLLDLPNSSIDMDLEFKMKSYSSYTDFLDSVDMYGEFRPTVIDMSAIGYFSGVLNEMPNIVGVTGKVSGPVSDLKGTDLRIRYLDDTRIRCNASIKGLPDFYSSYMEAEIFELSTTTCDIKQFRLPIDERTLDYTNEIDCGDRIIAKGDFKGYFKDFKTHIIVNSGEANLDAAIQFTEKENDTVFFKADLAGNNLKLGKILHQEETLGEIDFDLIVNGAGNNYNDLKIDVNGMLPSMDLLGYRYQRIRVESSFFADTIHANLRIGDKHLMMDTKGYLFLNDIPELKLTSSIRQVDFNSLGFYTGKYLSLKGDVDIDLKGFDLSTMEASAVLSKNTISFDNEVYGLDSLKLNKFVDEEGKNVIDLRSNIADVNLTGKYDIEKLPDQVVYLLNSYVKLLPEVKDKNFEDGEYANFHLNIKRDALIEEQFLTGIDLYPPYVIDGSMDFTSKEVYASSDFEKLGVAGMTLRDNHLRVKTIDNRFEIDYVNADVLIKDSTETDKTVFGLDSLKFWVDAGDDSLVYSLRWDNNDTLITNSGLVEGKLTTYNRISRFNVSNTQVYINDTLWRIEPDNLIVKDSLGLRFDEFVIFGGVSSLNLLGDYPKNDGDTLTVNFDSWNLSNFDIVTKLLNFELGGILNGSVNINVVDRYPAIVSHATVDSFYMNKVYIGNVVLFNTWNNQTQAISVKSRIVRKGNVGEGEVFSLNGNYYPFRDAESIDLDLGFNRLDLKAMESFIQDFVSDLEGDASGKMEIRGTMADPLLTGKIQLKRTSLNVKYLNTKYSFSNDIIFEREKIRFDKLVIYDTLGNFANVDGFLQHKFFKNPQFKVRISTDRLLFFNTTKKMNDLYYGSAITSGDIDISGSPRNIILNMDVKTMKGTNVFLPMDYSVEISDKDYIIFINHADTLEVEEEELEGLAKIEEEELAYNISLRMQITNDAEVTIYLPSEMGRIESQGNGILRMATNSTGDFSLIGDYNVDKGIFHFSLANLVRKRFNLMKGGRISWTGDPYTANVNIKGQYKLITDLSSLGVELDTTSNFRNRVMVDSYIILSNQLLNPDIRFEIKMPGLDPDQRRMVYANLDTTNQAVMNEQMISLLVLGTFSSSNSSSVGLNTSYYAVLSNQLSSMLSKISDDFDIGVNYRPGDNNTEEELEVALSTQLFNDRLFIDGHFGMVMDRTGESSGQTSASNIVGDVDVGYKITPDGRWILKAYNHSNVNSWYTTTNIDRVAPYTQGVGVAFRKDFTSLAELFQRTRARKKDRAKIEEENELIDENEDL